MNELMKEVVQAGAEKVANGNVAAMRDRLTALGMGSAAAKLKDAEKLQVAYSKYLFVSYEKVQAFNEKLRKDSEEKDAYGQPRYKRLEFLHLGQYPEVPPAHVLDALGAAQKDGCFDYFTVAKVVWHTEVKDPILFGHITNCNDYFFISQWDDDVKFEDILFMEKVK